MNNDNRAQLFEPYQQQQQQQQFVQPRLFAPPPQYMASSTQQQQQRQQQPTTMIYPFTPQLMQNHAPMVFTQPQLVNESSSAPIAPQQQQQQVNLQQEEQMSFILFAVGFACSLIWLVSFLKFRKSPSESARRYARWSRNAFIASTVLAIVCVALWMGFVGTAVFGAIHAGGRHHHHHREPGHDHGGHHGGHEGGHGGRGGPAHGKARPGQNYRGSRPTHLQLF